MKIIYFFIVLIIFIMWYNYGSIPCMSDANEIIDNLWVGNRVSSTNKEFLIKNNIKLIINCSRHLKFTNLPNIVKKRIDVHDDRSMRTNDIIYENLDNAIDKIEDNLVNGKGVLIHCKAGMQRSATIVAAYLMKTRNLNKKDAIKLIKSKRIITFLPDAHYDKLLDKYENELDNK